jgi:UDP-glucose 4-epimerase
MTECVLVTGGAGYIGGVVAAQLLSQGQVALGQRAQITGHPIPELRVERGPGDPSVLVASSEKIRSELKWQPEYPSLESIIRSAWEWRRAHPDGYREGALHRDHV